MVQQRVEDLDGSERALLPVPVPARRRGEPSVPGARRRAVEGFRPRTAARLPCARRGKATAVEGAPPATHSLLTASIPCCPGVQWRAGLRPPNSHVEPLRI